MLANGSRAGVALAALMRAHQAANESLMAGYQAWHAGDLPLPIIPTGPVTNV